MSLDLNADLGESWYGHKVGNDAALMPYLDSCNIACGFHGGDVDTQARCIELAATHGVAIGAHPSFPDRKNFGRRTLELDDDHLYRLVLYQVGGLRALVEAAGRKLHHLKPHGALYHYANNRAPAADALARCCVELSVPVLYGPPSGELKLAAARHGIEFWPEGFADRRYTPELRLVPRAEEGAVIEHVAEAVQQVQHLTEGFVIAADGERYPLRVATICVHGDHSGAAEKLREIRRIVGN